MATPRALIRLLHLEDNPRAAQLVRDRLEADHVPCEIFHVKSQAQFESAVAKRNFDMVLWDQNLPGCDGVSAIKHARKAQPNLPVIFLSGAMGDGGAAECRALNGSGFVRKYRLQDLAPTMKSFLGSAADRAVAKRAEVGEVAARRRRTTSFPLPTAAAA
jgi:DNA-binding response OmpR family regulator